MAYNNDTRGAFNTHATDFVHQLIIKYVPTAVVKGPALDGPRSAARYLTPLLAQEPSEVTGILLLDSHHRVLAWHEIGRGTLDSATVGPREVFRAAILANAASFVLAHNHPSGDPTPSRDDRLITSQLEQAADLMGIQMLDHIIIAAGGACYSLRE